jgi:hypothetical protein
MNGMVKWAKSKLRVDGRLIILYCLVYFLWGLGMNWFGIAVEIAKFGHWWQVVTCYILYMVPISLLLRNLPVHTQYAYGLIAMSLLEFTGYALETSYVFPNNIVDRILGERVFGLALALFFAGYFPMGNWMVGKMYALLFKDPIK